MNDPSKEYSEGWPYPEPVMVRPRNTAEAPRPISEAVYKCRFGIEDRLLAYYRRRHGQPHPDFEKFLMLRRQWQMEWELLDAQAARLDLLLQVLSDQTKPAGQDGPQM